VVNAADAGVLVDGVLVGTASDRSPCSRTGADPARRSDHGTITLAETFKR
jgi:hypothetical protein